MKIDSAAERRQPIRDARGPGAIVFDPARLRQAGPQWLDVATFGSSAETVVDSGRGAAWFVRGDFGEGVLRHYRRGGVAARLSRDRYLWTGESKVRSVAEFRLLAQMKSEGLPVPAPLMAGYWRQGLTYRAAILVERLPDVRSLAQAMAAGGADVPWEAVGDMLGRFHLAGIDHADLNAHNVLIDAADTPWLIDFDRGRRRSSSAAWRHANLDRLSRSLAKVTPAGVDWRDGQRRLLGAYHPHFPESVP